MISCYSTLKKSLVFLINKNKYVIEIKSYTSIFKYASSTVKKVFFSALAARKWTKCCVVAMLMWIVSWEKEERKKEEKHKWETRTQFFWYLLSYLFVYLSNHVCSSCSSTFRAKIHWNVLVLSAVYRKLLNYKMVNKIYFKDQCIAVPFVCIMMTVLCLDF